MSLKLETRLYIMDEAMIKILKEEKQYNDINYYNMKVALEYKKSTKQKWRYVFVGRFSNSTK